MNNIKELVKTRLREIERREKVKILYAVESGSRGWGFESKDSDYDVRFIYAHSLDRYLSIDEKRDVIEYPISDNLDISGWDVKKALKLFKNSSPPLYEWLNSPIIYMEKGNFARRLRALMFKFYSPVSSLHHYLHMAQRNHKSYFVGRQVKVKKYLYVLRPIFACMWIETKKSMPPMEFEKLLNSQKLNEELTNEIRKLLERKKAGEELSTEDRIEVIDNFLEGRLKYFEGYSKKLAVEKRMKDDFLDDLFREVVKNQKA